jgi:hypothetical protein
MKGHDIEDRRVRMRAAVSKIITHGDIVLFGGVPGDRCSSPGVAGRPS